MSKTKSSAPLVAPLQGEDLARFMYSFATMKYIATNSKNVERSDAWTVAGPTSIGVSDFHFDSPAFISAVNQEYQTLWTRMDGVIARAKPEQQVEAFNNWINAAKKQCRQFQRTYSSHIDNLNKTNARMAAVLGFAIRSAAVGQACAEIALTLSGIGLAGGGVVKVVASSSTKMIVGEFVTAVGTSSAISVAETWSQTKNCDAVMVMMPATIATEGLKAAPGTYAETLSQNADKLLKEAPKHLQNSKVAQTLETNIRSMRGRPLPNNIRRTLMRKVSSQKQLAYEKTRTANSNTSASKGLKFLGYLIAVKSTHDSLKKMVDHWNFKV